MDNMALSFDVPQEDELATNVFSAAHVSSLAGALGGNQPVHAARFHAAGGD